MSTSNSTITTSESTTSTLLTTTSTTILTTTTTSTTSELTTTSTTSLPTESSTTTSDIETSTQSSTRGTTTISITTTATRSSTSSSTTTSPTDGPGNPGLSPGGGNSGGGLEGSALIAVAVIVPIVIIALLVVGALLFFRKRKDRRSKISLKGASDLGGTGAVGMAATHSNSDDGGYEMSRGGDSSGYRGWGSTAGGRKSTGLASSVGTAYPMASVGRSVSDGSYGNNTDMYGQPTTPSGIGSSSVNINAPLLDRPIASPAFTEGSTIGAMPTFDTHHDGLNRGISNASSNYSAVTHSDHSDYHAQSYYSGEPQEYGASYFVNGPSLYSDDPANPPPVIRDVQARRHTRIETPTGTHQTGSSGIAQNF